MKTFADKIKAARKRLGISQPLAAARCGVSMRTYCHWEAGTRTPLPPTQEGALARLK